MALTPDQKSSRLFKKSFGAAETLIARDFFEEPKLGNKSILPSQIWAEAEKIPTTAPTLSNGQSQGVVKYHEKLELTHIPGSQNKSYFDELLKDAIPFNYSDGSYNYSLFKNDGTTVIPFGDGDWLVDTSAGVITFYGTLPSSVSDTSPPKISFYQYIGDKGLQQSGVTTGIDVKDPVIAATTGQTDATYSTTTSGFTSLPSEIDGITTFSEGDRFLIKDQTNEYENGIYEVSGTTLVRAYDHDGTPSGEVSVNNYCFVTSGTTNISKSYVLSYSDAEDPYDMTPGVDSQVWKLFSEGLSYNADGQAIKLNGTTFSLDLDDTSGNSGLYQSNDGLKLDTSITNAISGNTSDITSLDNELSTEISNRISGDTSLENAIGDIDFTSLENEITGNTSDITSLENQVIIITGDTSSLETAISDEITDRVSGDTSLENAIGDIDFTSLENEITGNTSDITSLETTISDEITDRVSGDTSLETALNNFSGVTEDTAGSGLTYLSGNQTLNINVDDYTIKIVNDELRTPETWIETDKITTILTGTGATNIELDYEPVGYISAFINGIEYIVNPTPGSSATDMPFFFDSMPTIGSTLNFDADEAGFGIESGTDLITVKYSFIDMA